MAITIERFCYMPIVGLASACAVLISNANGAQSPLWGMKKILWNAIVIAMTYCILFAVFVNVFPNLIAVLFSYQKLPNNLIGVSEATFIILTILPIFLLLNSFSLICMSVIEAFQEVKFKIIVVLSSTLTLFIPGIYILITHYHTSIVNLWLFLIGIYVLYAILYYLRCMKHLRCQS
jgi:Na+-driven multidrug efflux pump